MKVKLQTSTQRCRGGYTLIEMVEVIAAIALGALLAEKVSLHFDGTWRSVVLWSSRTVGSGIFFLCFLFGVNYLAKSLRRQQDWETSKE